jgi:predicted PurR-regulated permease PerM
VKVFPDSMTPVLRKYHLRIRDTLYGIYVVQAATAFLTFLVALPVFWLLGYEAFFTLALLCGLLQFIPVVGPSVVIAAVAGFDLLGGMITRAFLVFVIGLLLIGALPDAVLRPRLANRATGLPASLYFLGFIGGVLTVGPIGIIVGPLVIALILETVELLAYEP